MTQHTDKPQGESYGRKIRALSGAGAVCRMAGGTLVVMTETDRRHLESDRNARLDAVRSLGTARLIFMDEAERRYASAADIARLAPATA